jgi:tetratricopeptide (TPR) repeat protein
VGQGSGVLAAGRGEGHSAVSLPRGHGVFRAALSALQHLPEQRATREQAVDLPRALALATAVGDVSPHTMANQHLGFTYHDSLGEAQLLAGRQEEAHALAERTLALARSHEERGHQAYALRLLGEIAVQCEPPERDLSEAHYRQALALAEELGMRPLQAHCHHSLGTLYATIGRRAEARAELDSAIKLYRAMEMTLWLPEAEAVLAQVEERP